jgi:hypothetical protein
LFSQRAKLALLSGETKSRAARSAVKDLAKPHVGVSGSCFHNSVPGTREERRKQSEVRCCSVFLVL